MTLPKFKKQLQAFLCKEEGNITKQQVLRAGIFALGIGVVTSIPAASEIECSEEGGHNQCDTECDNPCAGSKEYSCNEENHEDQNFYHTNEISFGMKEGSASGSHNHCYSPCTTQHCSHHSY